MEKNELNFFLDYFDKNKENFEIYISKIDKSKIIPQVEIIYFFPFLEKEFIEKLNKINEKTYKELLNYCDKKYDSLVDDEKKNNILILSKFLSFYLVFYKTSIIPCKRINKLKTFI
jgi:hypothetical protein